MYHRLRVERKRFPLADVESVFGKMKTGAEKLGKDVGHIARIAVSKVESTTKEAKIRYAIRCTEERKKANFEAIGEAVYSAYASNTEPGDFSETYGIIDALNDEIAELKRQLGED